MTDWFQLERCYVTPIHCSHKIIKVAIITKLPEKNYTCNITRNAKLVKIVIKYTSQKQYTSLVKKINILKYPTKDFPHSETIEINKFENIVK